MSTKTLIDRSPPNSPEAEQGVLGCILQAPKECLGQLASAGKIVPESMYDLRHQTILATALEMFDSGEALDLITLQQRLKDRGQLEAVGGLAYLSALPEATPSAANLEYYAKIVWEKSILRQVVQTCTETVSKVFDWQGEVDELLDGIERDIFALAQTRATPESSTIRQLVRGTIDRVESAMANQGQLQGIATGLVDLDRKLNGFQPGHYIVLAARPSAGKTSLAMNVAEHVACDLALPVGVFSLEMTAEELSDRMVCSRARINHRDLMGGNMVNADAPKFTNAAAKIAASPLFIDDTAGISILQLRAKARRWHQQHAVRLLAVDYIQLLCSTNRRAGNREQEISDISRGLKNLAKELRIPILVLSQLNRANEKEKRRPKLSDLRESGSIEQDSDVVLMLHNDSEDKDEPTAQVECIVAKQRSGPTGPVNLVFLKPYTRFESAAHVQREDMPQTHAHNDP